MACHERIRARRLELGLSQRQLSKRLMPYLPVMTKGAISKIENDNREVLARELPYFAMVLRCRMEDLVDPVEA